MTDAYYTYYNTVATGAIYTYPPTGTIQFPQQSLQILDPTINAIATFFKQILTTNLLPRFANECAACGMTNANLDAFVDGVAVAQTLVFPVNEQLMELDEFRFPLLAIQPVDEQYVALTLTNVATKRTFSVSWILPPLTPFQYNRLYPFFSLASKTLLAYGTQGYDPKTNPIGPSIWQQIGITFGFMEGVSYEPYKWTRTKRRGEVPATFPCFELGISFFE